MNYDATLVGEGGLAQIHTVILASGKQSMDIHSSSHMRAQQLLAANNSAISYRKVNHFPRAYSRRQAAQGTDSEQL